jgi:hypothetical protein
MQSTFSNVFDQVSRKIKALNQTPLEKEVSDATSNDNWGVANSTLIQLARQTNDFNNYTVIMKEVWEGLSEKKEKWRRIYKSLVLLEYCVKYGAERVCNEARSESYKLRPLFDFKHMEEGREKGPGIREKSKYISDLLSDAESLKRERSKALDGKDKYVGIASNGGGGQTVITSSGYSAGNSTFSSSGSRAVMPSISNENNTNKLDEYREKDRQKKSAQSSQRSSVINEPVISSSGKVVIKPLPVNNNSSRKVSSSASSSSSSSEDSSPEKQRKNVPTTSNLIDFDSPVARAPQVVPQVAPAPQVPSNPFNPVQQTGFSYMQQPTPMNYMQPQVNYMPTVPVSYMQPVVSPQTNAYIQPPTQPYNNPYGTVQPANKPQMCSPGYPAYVRPSTEPPKDNNPFAAFNGL